MNVEPSSMALGSPRFKSLSPWSRRRTRAGFSLVEIVLAVGIVAGAVVSIVSLLPAGMNVFRQSINYSVGSHIAQTIINEAQQTDFSVLTANPGSAKPVRYFDDQGSEMKTATETFVVYHVNTQVIATTAFPGATAKNASVATVTIQVANNPGNQALGLQSGSLLWADTNKQPIATYSSLVARNK